MNRYWFLLVDRTGARVYQTSAAGAPLELLGLIACEPQHEAGDPPAVLATESVGFARQLSAWCEQARVKLDYDRLILTAAPRFLQLLRAQLTPGTGATVFATIAKDLTGVPDDQLVAHFAEVLPPPE